jgi:hypothetical protein
VNAPHVMIDLETFSLAPNAAIFSIGAVKFDPAGSDVIDSFEVGINELPWDVRAENPFHFDMGTVQWWLHEDRAEPLQYQRKLITTDLASALDGFATWYGPHSLPTWAMSATHDLTVLRFALRQYQFETPWKYWDEQEVRTALLMHPTVDRKYTGFNVGLPGPFHTALTDAIWQSRLVQACYKARSA